MLSSPTTNETNLLKKSSSKGDVEKESQPLSTDSKKFSIIIPAYNEENRIKPVLEDIVDYITQNNLDWDIILAIDGNDGTEVYVRNIMNQYQFVSYTKGKGRSGKGGAIKRSLGPKLGDFVILMDADGAISFKDIIESIPLLEEYDVVNFDRYKGRENKIPFIRRFVSRGYNILLRILLGIKINDTQCGYKIIQTDIAKKIFEKTTITNGFFYSSLFFYLQQLNTPIIEVPIKYNHITGSKFNVSSMVMGGLVSAIAFRIRMSPLSKFIPKVMCDLYYKKFRWI